MKIRITVACTGRVDLRKSRRKPPIWSKLSGVLHIERSLGGRGHRWQRLGDLRFPSSQILSSDEEKVRVLLVKVGTSAEEVAKRFTEMQDEDDALAGVVYTE